MTKILRCANLCPTEESRYTAFWACLSLSNLFSTMMDCTQCAWYEAWRVPRLLVIVWIYTIRLETRTRRLTCFYFQSHLQLWDIYFSDQNDSKVSEVLLFGNPCFSNNLPINSRLVQQISALTCTSYCFCFS